MLIFYLEFSGFLYYNYILHSAIMLEWQYRKHVLLFASGARFQFVSDLSTCMFVSHFSTVALLYYDQSSSFPITLCENHGFSETNTLFK